MASWDAKGKFAVVTGAGSGVNLAFAEQLLKAGCSVIFADIALRPEAEELIAKYPHPSKDESPSAVYHKMDQSNWAQVAETWEFALKTFGRVDLLCPGAGIWEPPTSSFWDLPGVSPLAKDDPNAAPGVYNIFAVNAMGPIRFAQIAIDYWLQNKIAGNLIFVSSLSAYLPTIGTPLYNATKGALNSFTLSLAQMKARLGIRVASMCPATTFTPAVLQPYCVGKVREQDMNMSATECAEVMLRIVTDAGYGDGQVVEAMQFGSKEKSDVRVRVVPYQSLLPDIDFEGDFSGKNILVEEEKLWEKLKTEGVRS
ncbi:putative oxidoreductase [Colletotrichum sp. SAR11_59]|uniref:Nad-dependent 15-hydroxyprostaglandin dehydrogenase n=1 Tax=Colletotrichum asianum TaxID=702518 RepID=A0A8H3W3K9_9PEZI|nr:nad-dependent 15-hydroxyprostaglandin dehydrogenase [Colletotrichum asianum]KAI8311111.1 putative oxidoreductase [Colletotrichum sp. SAR11_59]